MALSFFVFGTDDEFPSSLELLDILEESDFEVSLEDDEDDEDHEDDEDWTTLLIFEESLEEPITVKRLTDESEFDELAAQLAEAARSAGDGAAVKDLVDHFEAATIGFTVELHDANEDDDNALLLCALIAQTLAARCDGIYSAGGGAFFDETGELLLDLAGAEDES
jgi:hypothetical protein